MLQTNNKLSFTMSSSSHNNREKLATYLSFTPNNINNTAFNNAAMVQHHRITHILDLDGFILSSGFLCKELALIEVASGKLLHSKFRLDCNFEQLDAIDRKRVEYVTNYVHGITFADSPDEIFSQTDVAIVLFNLLRNGYHKLSNVLVGYKGGTLERDLLFKLRIPSINLETIACPKFDILFNDITYKHLIDDCATQWRDMLQNCPLHNTKNQTITFHCAKIEVIVFRAWFLRCYLQI